MATISTLSGFFKKRYGKLSEAVPEHAIMHEKIPFEQRKADKLGQSYDFPVRMRRAMGWTFSAAGTAFTLNSAVAGQMVNATVSGQSFVLREQISYDAAAYATSSEEAFGDTFDDVVKDMANSAALAREIAILYGNSDIGVIAIDGTNNATQDLTITVASCSVGLWAQMEGGKIDVYDTTLATKRNAANDITVNSVTPVESGTYNGSVLVNVTGNATELDSIVATDRIVPKGATSTSWMVGVDAIARNTGTLFGIAANTYPLWKANLYSVGTAELSMLKLTKAVGRAVVRSSMAPMTALVSVPTWTDLNNNHAALRRFAESTKGGLDLGTSKITYYGPNGKLDIEPHPHIKNGEAFCADWSLFKRIGASDLTFQLEGGTPETPNFFQHLENVAAYEMRCYWSQAIIDTRPAGLVKLTDIVNSV